MDRNVPLHWINPRTLNEEDVAVPTTDDEARNLLRGTPHESDLLSTFDEHRNVFRRSRREALLRAAERARETRMEEAQERQRRFNEERHRCGRGA